MLLLLIQKGANQPMEDVYALFFAYVFLILFITFIYTLIPALRRYPKTRDIYLLDIPEKYRIYLFIYMLAVSFISTVLGIFFYLVESGTLFSSLSIPFIFCKLVSLRFFVFLLMNSFAVAYTLISGEIKLLR